MHACKQAGSLTCLHNALTLSTQVLEAAHRLQHLEKSLARTKTASSKGNSRGNSKSDLARAGSGCGSAGSSSWTGEFRLMH